MKIDMHVHSTFSPDSRLDISMIVKQCEISGIDGVCLTEHHSYKASEPVENLSLPIRIFRGVEAATDIGHILLFGIKDESWNSWDGISGHRINANNLLKYINSIGAVGILAHPFRKPKCSIDTLLGLKGLTAVEAYNSHFPQDVLKATWLSKCLGIKTVGGSDAHATHHFGHYYTMFERDITTIDELVNELKSGHYYGTSNATKSSGTEPSA